MKKTWSCRIFLKYLVVVLLFLGCSKNKPTIGDTRVSRSASFQVYIDKALELNLENKKWEVIYLDQIEQAKEHNDTEAFNFFTEEHSKLNLFLPEWMKREVGYVPRFDEQLQLDLKKK